MKASACLQLLCMSLLVFAAAIVRAEPPDSSSTALPLASPAPPGSAEPNLAVAADGSVYLSWLEPAGDGAHALRFARLERTDGPWSAARTITERADLFVNWADFPSLLPAGDGRLIAHWLQQRVGGAYAYDVRVALSPDQGLSWSESRVLHGDGVAAEHGFVSLLESPRGDVQAFWLDGRQTADAEAHGAMMLAHTTLDAQARPGVSEPLDDRTCDCCQTAAAWTAAGPVVVYRDRDAAEIRDIAILRKVDGAWMPPALVADDGWRIEGCPVNGPAVAARGELLAVAWFTAAAGKAQVKLAFSRDSGAHFAAPIVIDADDPQGRVDVLLDASGRVWVLWLARSGEADGAEIRLRSADSTGISGAEVVVARTNSARRSGFPRMVMSGSNIVLAWTDADAQTAVRLARLEVGS